MFSIFNSPCSEGQTMRLSHCSPELLTRTAHQNCSPERLTRTGHQHGSPERVTRMAPRTAPRTAPGMAHQNSSPEPISTIFTKFRAASRRLMNRPRWSVSPWICPFFSFFFSFVFASQSFGSFDECPIIVSGLFRTSVRPLETVTSPRAYLISRPRPARVSQGLRLNQ